MENVRTSPILAFPNKAKTKMLVAIVMMIRTFSTPILSARIDGSVLPKIDAAF